MPPPNLDEIRQGQARNAVIFEQLKQQVFSDSIISFKPPATNPNIEFLGAGPLAAPQHSNRLGLVNNGQKFPAFQKLGRQTVLSGKCRIVAPNPQDQDLVQKIWDNNCITYQLTYNESLLPDGLSFLLTVYCDGELVVGYRGYPKEVPGSAVWAARPDSILERLEEEDQEALIFRISHQLLRTFAYFLPMEKLRGLHDMSCPRLLTSKKHAADNLDFCVMWADLYLNFPFWASKDDQEMMRLIYNQMTQVGFALVTLGRFEDAAALSLEISEYFAEELAIDKFGEDNVPQSFWAAGTGFLVQGKENEALQYYVKHLELAIRNDPNPDFCNYEFTLTSILKAYFSKIGKIMQCGESIKTSSGASSAIGFTGLVAAAHPKLWADGKATSWPSCQVMTSCLKKEFQRQAYAKEQLVKIMKWGSLEELNSVSHQCVDQNKLNNHQFSLGGDMDEWNQRLAEDFRKGNRTNIKIHYSPKCAQCGSGERLQQCPCKGAHYCSKQCQIMHYPTHKSNCTDYLLKKMKKKAKPANGIE